MITFIDLAKCTGCSICVRVCPTDVLRMVDSGGARAARRPMPVIVHRQSCFTCYNCEVFCPQDCVHVSPFRKPIPALLAGFLNDG